MPHAAYRRLRAFSLGAAAPFFPALAATALAAANAEGLPSDESSGMFGGGLINALFLGEPFTGPRLADIVIIGLVVFMLFRFFAGRRTPSTGPDRAARPTPSPAGGRTPSGPSTNGHDPASSDPQPSAPPKEGYGPGTSHGPGPEGREPGLERAYQAAEAAWGGLRSAPSAGKPAPAGAQPAFHSEDEEFVAGAKAVYARVREAMEKGDVSGMAPFVAPEFMGELARMATARAAQTGGKTSQLLLVDAGIATRVKEGNTTRIETLYEVLAKMPGQSGDDRERETWTFVRDESTPGAMWLLAGIKAA
ncbi:hypothetical protein G3N56_17440 [Desulfovibrio sulfodismutans]|uniref:Tim44-like domain-containing protein n=1 Tax=Desulfolutivibrio sulfodismutans TaxID=63561 RepID=A0A7K3NQW6_9BACT|nr:hypothetical protein [Desulfolutivibrio sulfodismutans]NDY58521.1 hypothetical protein [Desulfolutivibrio sulfodismutans]QLA10884.1 hypothetical protein GD606_00595 [Desulfolutivibrio sulfodismutans DSM 3696]